MKIILDPQIFNDQKYGGISRYYNEIFSVIVKKSGVNIKIPFFNITNAYLIESKLFVEQKSVPYFLIKILNLFRISTRSLTKKNSEKSINKMLSQQDFDVFIPTYYNPYFINFIGSKPFVLTVYDMIHELFPHYFNNDYNNVENKKLLIEKATKIIAISESTKNDILKIYPHIDSSKIEVVYLSCNINTSQITHLKLPEEYILFVGSRNNYKNFIFFINAVAPILKSKPDLFVVCAGGNKFNNSEIILLENLGISNQIIQNNFEENELYTYYFNAKCFVFPSEYEGFGIPVLEAMKCSCPVVLANHSSFPEVAGDAGVYFELNNQLDLKNKINELLDDNDLRNSYIQKGLVQAAKFSWEKTANECLKVYQKAITE